jgi:hypothetical protein
MTSVVQKTSGAVMMMMMMPTPFVSASVWLL